ncbi:MAG: D-alanine--D-alanine ligase [Synergistaceae bacterium]|jgi:D-alanine-D-alanine ligase|nr:D-alanine--D-alanine ligase [Synergistaceae bacterium]
MGIRVGVFFGGRSVEHEVSIISAIQAINAFDSAKYDVTPVYMDRSGDMYVGEALGRIEEYRDIPALLKKSRRVLCARDSGALALVLYPPKKFGSSVYRLLDAAFPIVHGTNVEDGALQGFFRTMSIPFVGPDVLASATGMDKFAAKAILRGDGIPVLDCARVYIKSFFKDPDAAILDIERDVQYPMIVKPINLGSSIGISLASDSRGLKGALEYAFQYSDTALAERAVPNLKEINCAVLGDYELAIASECEEPINSDEILSYENKYLGGPRGSKGMSGARRKFPADITPETRDLVRDLAVRTFHSLRCSGVSRVDLLMDSSSGEVWVNEINTIPGSLSYYLWTPAGITYGDLLDRLVQLALKRERHDAEFTYSFETNILANFKQGTKNAKRIMP